MVAEADLVADSAAVVGLVVAAVDSDSAVVGLVMTAVDSDSAVVMTAVDSDSAVVMTAVDSDSVVKVRCNRLWYKSPIQRHKSWIPYLSGTYNNRHLMYS